MDDPTLDETPAARAARWLQPSPGELVGLIILLLGAVTASGLLWLQASQRPSTLENEATAVGVAVAPDGSTHGPAPGGAHELVGDLESSGAGEEDEQDSLELTVHVTGAVVAPGLVVLPAGGRVGEAVSAAGGLTEEALAERINLARPLVDGEHVHVPREGEEPLPAVEGAAGGGSAASDVIAAGGITADGLVDLNHATPQELETLPGVGPARAEAIVAHREEHGPFAVPGDLRGVTGIGEATFQHLAELVSTG